MALRSSLLNVTASQAQMEDDVGAVEMDVLVAEDADAQSSCDELALLDSEDDVELVHGDVEHGVGHEEIHVSKIGVRRWLREQQLRHPLTLTVVSIVLLFIVLTVAGSLMAWLTLEDMSKIIIPPGSNEPGKRILIQRHGTTPPKRVPKSACTGRWLRDIDHIPQFVISSPKTYALETCFATAAGMGYNGTILVDPSLHSTFGGDYHGIDAPIEMIRQVDDDVSLLLFTGHDPSCHKLITWLTGVPNNRLFLTYEDIEDHHSMEAARHGEKYHDGYVIKEELGPGNDTSDAVGDVVADVTSTGNEDGAGDQMHSVSKRDSRITRQGTVAEVYLPIRHWADVWHVHHRASLLSIAYPPTAFVEECPHGDGTPINDQDLIQRFTLDDPHHVIGAQYHPEMLEEDYLIRRLHGDL